MIIVKLWGGLGNQMFQYAFGKSMAIKHDDDLYFDITFYEKQPSYVGKRSVELLKFKNISLNIYKRDDIICVFENKYINHIVKLLGISRLSLRNDFVFIPEKLGTKLEDIPYMKGKKNYYDGYWMSTEYYHDVRPLLMRDFSVLMNNSPFGEMLKQANDNPNSVAIHIRRGDLLNRRNSKSILTEDYYMNCIKTIASKVKNPAFYVFSDDIEWVKTNIDFENHNRIYVSGMSELELLQEFEIMRNCNNYIISKSTFSWWAQYLSDNSSKIVLIPKIMKKSSEKIKGDYSEWIPM